MPTYQKTLQIGILLLLAALITLSILWNYFEHDTSLQQKELTVMSEEQQQQQSEGQQTEATIPADIVPETAPAQTVEFVTPMSKFATRITKKPFGIFINPDTSPVQPERFKGYHSGADLEVTAAEITQDVNIFSIADGVVKSVDTISGYGGVVVISFNSGDASYTALYGHIKKISVAFRPGDTIKRGQKIGVLGNDKSDETDGERKHLHFSIHKGGDVVFAGYADSSSQLSAWVDPVTFLKNAQDIDTL